MSDPLDLRGGFEIETPEQVAFRLERAGLGARTLAALVDNAILAALYIACLLAFGGASALFGGESEEAFAWAIGILVLVLTLLTWGYYIAFELVWNGQTPGKRLLKIRVVGDAGVPVTAGQVVTRNLIRIIDLQFAYAVGMIAIFASKEEKRLGDLAAGTVVVTERRRARAAHRSGAVTASGRTLDPDLLDLVRDYWARSPELDARTRHRIARDLANRMAQGLGRDPVAAIHAEQELREMTELALGRPGEER